MHIMIITSITSIIGIQTGNVTKVTGSITSPIGIAKKEGRNERIDKGNTGIHQLF